MVVVGGGLQETGKKGTKGVRKKEIRKKGVKRGGIREKGNGEEEKSIRGREKKKR